MSADAVNAAAPTGETQAVPARFAECLRPLRPHACGEDPRYGDRFAFAQEQINRLSGTDFDAVAERCIALLTTEAKDLRACGYLAVAELARSGIGGFADALELTAALAVRFGNDLHPRRASARASALRFLAGERSKLLLTRPGDTDPEAVFRLDAALERLHDALANTLEMDAAPLGGLRESVAALTRTAARPSPQPAATAAEKSAPAGTSSAAPAPTVTAPTEDADYHGGMRRLLGFLREAGRWGEHVALARAYRWTGLAAPPAQSGRTRIEPPRAAALAAVAAACAEQRWADGLAAAERAFLEPGGQFVVAVQRHAVECAQALEWTEIAACITDGVRRLHARLPALRTLAFNDGTPFAAGEDQAWLDALFADSEPADRPDVSDGERWTQALAVLAESGLEAALAELGAERGDGGRDRAQVRLRQAELCLEAKRPDAARPILEGIDEDLRRGGHDLWDRTLAADVLRALLRATERDGGQDAEARAGRIATLRERLARVDLATALAGRP